MSAKTNRTDWHRERKMVLNLFKMHPSVTAYAKRYYNWLFKGPRETVSLHLRLGYKGEPEKRQVEARKFPSDAWFKKIILSEFTANTTRFLVFSDNAQIAALIAAPYIEAGYDLIVIDENPVVSLHLMSRCTHHVLTSSTFSFWSAYLDPRQPDGGRTIVPPQFFINHGRHTIPYDEWEVIDVDDDVCTNRLCE